MAAKSRVEAAFHEAARAAKEPHSQPADGRPRTIHTAIGDPQAPLSSFFNILDTHGLLGDDGRLKPEVALTSIGDHFDYGPPAWRKFATQEGLQLLAWLASHPADQVTIILGNHDLARVDQLHGIDQKTYERAREDADRAYNLGSRIDALQAAFLARWPQFPDSEMVARDYSSFSVRQRGLVTLLLRAKRFRLAQAAGDRLLLVHAGVTKADLESIGAPLAPAPAVAAALNRFLDDAVARWAGGQLVLMPLHRPGTQALGDARGILSHRPAHPERAWDVDFQGPPLRRFDPRELPLGLTQVIGHIRDKKCREVLGDWCEPGEAKDGPLRQLKVDGRDVRYGRGTSSDAQMLFIDGGMSTAEVSAYEMIDLDTVKPLARRAP
jgi:hypothetical protein